ncbi:MAG: copper amine oxidase N-terminal domain-containing protein [Clostridiaceae bacterium]
MKKLFISILMTLLLLISIPAAISGAEANRILEEPDVRVIMDGKLTVYQDVPISTGQRTLLPLREMLVNLGVPNDDGHIIYNELEKSVTVLKDQTRIYLTEGDKTAYVDEQPITLDVVPVLYEKNKRMYIPLRFVAEALDKKVVWDGPANSIYICDVNKFEQMKVILGKVDEAMKLTVKLRQSMDADANVKTDPSITHIGIHVDTQIDKALKKMSMGMCLEMPGIAFKSSAYYADQASYIQDILTQKWQKKIHLPSEYDKLFASQSDMTVLNITESLCAGLTQVTGAEPQAADSATHSGGTVSPAEGSTPAVNSSVSATEGTTSAANSSVSATEGSTPAANGSVPSAIDLTPSTEGADPDEILLQGDVFLTDMFNRALEGQNIKKLISSVKNTEFETFHVELSINPSTKLISSISMNVAICQKNKEEDIKTDMNIRILYSEYNGSFDIIIPEDVLTDASEVKQNDIQGLETPGITE